jgi:quinol monooxygenase YgiN
MAAFVQIIEFTTSQPQEVEALLEEIRRQRESSGVGPSPRRATLTADRDHPGRYFSVLEFESYETAMQNSRRPETSAFAARMADLCDGPPKFYNLDIVQTWQPRE